MSEHESGPPERPSMQAPERIKAALEAEPEPDEEEDEDTTPQAPPEDVAPVDPRAAAVGDAYALYLAAVEEMLGADAEIVPCELCEGRGFNPQQYPPDPTAETCPDCLGYGRVRTGSIVPDNQVRNCNRCMGRGYVERTPTPIVPPNAAAANAEPGTLVMPPTPVLVPIPANG